MNTPRSRPQAKTSLVLGLAQTAFAKKYPGRTLPNIFVVGVRGYYSETFQPAGNDVGVYDDAMFVFILDKMFPFNANTDPSRYGWNANAGKYMARLQTGVWDFVRLKHRGKYMAFGQGDNAVYVDRVGRDKQIEETEFGCFGINLHKGGMNGTSSEGCLTIPTSQWTEFDDLLATAIKSQKNTFPLVLINGPIN